MIDGRQILKSFVNWVVPFVASWAVKSLYRVIRTECIVDKGLQKIWDQNEHVILISWHEQILMMAPAYPGPGIKLLISQSSDGEMLARAMKHFGYGAIRGSSSRGGRAAFKQMLKIAEEPFDIALTPDGPRGPRQELKDGVLQLARLSGRPVVPVCFACSKGHRFHSWDRFLCPYPLARAVYYYGQPVFYDEEAGIDDFRKRLLTEIDRNQQHATEYLESYGLSAV